MPEAAASASAAARCAANSSKNSSTGLIRGMPSRESTPVTASRYTWRAAYVSIRQHTSAYVSIRQHTSAYVSILLLCVRVEVDLEGL